MAMEKQLRTRDIKLISIGNSKGVRLPKTLLQKYGFNNALLLEETDRGLLLRNKEDDKISWEDTYREMASEKEDWDDFDSALLDGLEDEAIEY
jgi:antitoxin MazE